MAMKRQRSNENIDLVNCLMLLSCPQQKTIENGEYECKTCNKKFSSFQALGGHRASHKRVKLSEGEELKEQAKSLSLWNKPKMHECSICGMGFSLGQALGGHMRKHRALINEGVSSINEIMAKIPILKRSNSKRVMGLDLNLTPLENDDLMMFGMKSPLPLTPIPLSLF
ncbi:zinc finger protein ZAT11 [Trifolium repens]|jgi:cell division protein YceG involved in septum cleavage|nr:zinc finger protein ZAT11 [Trifolium repens]